MIGWTSPAFKKFKSLAGLLSPVLLDLIKLFMHFPTPFFDFKTVKIALFLN
jgi:hypothetical protein